MNFISSILKGSIKSLDKQRFTILLIDKEKEDLINFLKPLEHNFIYYSDLYYGGMIPNLILCNNKIDYYYECKTLSSQYHIPSIIIDHNIKSNVYDEDKIKFLDNLPCSFKVATSMAIYKSWHSIHDKILPYANGDDKLLQSWSETLDFVSKKEFFI